MSGSLDISEVRRVDSEDLKVPCMANILAAAEPPRPTLA